MSPAAVFVLLLGAAACHSAPGADDPALPKASNIVSESKTVPELDPSAIQAEVSGFSELFQTTVAGTASTIATQTTDPTVRERTLRWRLGFITAMQNAMLDPDPRSALASAWAIAARQRYVLTRKTDKPLFGDQQELALTSATELEQRIVEIAKRYVPESKFAPASQEIEEFATTTSVSQQFTPPQLKKRPDRTGGLADLLALPLAPLTGLQGIGDTPEEIHRLTRVAGEWTQMIRAMPEQLRWQTEVLALSLEDMPTLKAVRDFSTSAHELSSNVSELPAKFGEQLRTTIDASKGTIETVHASVSEAKAAIEQVDASIAKVEPVLASVRSTAAELRTTVDASEHLVQSIHTAFPPRPEPETKAGASATTPEEPTNLMVIRDGAHNIETATVEVRALIADLKSSSTSDSVSALSRTSRDAVDHAADRADALVDRIFWRGLALIVATVVLFTLARLVLRSRQPRTVVQP